MSDPDTLARLAQEIRDAEAALEAALDAVIRACRDASTAARRAMERRRKISLEPGCDAARADAYARYEAAERAYEDAGRAFRAAVAAHRAAQEHSDD